MSVSPELSLGKLLANTSSIGYTTTGGNRFSNGQCTWYCAGRAFEKKGIKIVPLLPSSNANAGVWYDKITTNAHVIKRTVAAGPTVDCIASFKHNTCGHVVYIETQLGNYTYYTEWNWNQGMNGKLQKVLTKNFANIHSGCTLNGYIVIR
jgi:surface antigen